MSDKLFVLLYRRQHVLAPEYFQISSPRRQKGGVGGYGRTYVRFFDEIEEGAVEAMGSRLGALLAGVLGAQPLVAFFSSTFLFHKRKVEKKNN